MGEKKSRTNESSKADQPAQHKFWRRGGGRQILLKVRLTPKAAKDAIDGIGPGASHSDNGSASSGGAILQPTSGRTSNDQAPGHSLRNATVSTA